MRKALVKVNKISAGILVELSKNDYSFTYHEAYTAQPISLTMPLRKEAYSFSTFPTFFDGLLPEGIQLDGLLKKNKIDKHDYFSQLIATGQDLVGAITVEELIDE
jgi:serine/threonine-protein kinase HipA